MGRNKLDPPPRFVINYHSLRVASLVPTITWQEGVLW